MKSFAEANGKTPFNWYAFLNQESWTEDELFEACTLAGSWVTCACGNQCDAIPRNVDEFNEPDDEELSRLGVEFYTCIQMLDADKEYVKYALETLADIEKRSAEILKEMGVIPES